MGFLRHATTTATIIANSAITPNVTSSSRDKLPVSGDSVWIFGTSFACSLVVGAANNINANLNSYIILSHFWKCKANEQKVPNGDIHTIP